MNGSQLKVSQPVCVVPAGDACGEGILWDAGSQSVYWTDINRFLVHRYSPAEQTQRTWFFSEPVTCVLATSHKGLLALVKGSGVCLWEPATDHRHDPLFALPGWPRVRCNDAGVDPGGRIWVGTMRNNVAEDGQSTEAGGTDGVLYRVEASGAVTEWKRDIGVSNTFLWSPDKTRFYFGDSFANCIWQYTFRQGEITSEQIFFEKFSRGLPDGSAMDSEGCVWNCRYGGNCIVRVAPNGEVDRVVDLPVSNPTNCTFGGPDLTTLYVTSANATDKWERFGGGLFAIETNVRGRADHAFGLPASYGSGD